ncbi:MAG: HEAT repeat domain-containing protein [Chloroflexi bacterium]|nr:HEAT repeat domain-containing protein [Chloroflexota bacterium]
MSTNRKTIPFQQILEALLDDTTPFPSTYLHRFSDIDLKDLSGLKQIWPKVAVKRRRAILEDLEELADADTLVSFDDVGRFTLEDPDAQVRATAIRLLWESEDKKLVPVFIRMMETDSDHQVRAAAANALGMFVYLGELEEIPQATLRQVEDSLLHVTTGQDHVLVRRRALESLGYSSRPEVAPLLEKAFGTTNAEWLASSLFAMGRSADQQWEKKVLAMLDHPLPNVRLEAARAAGELELKSAQETLMRIAQSNDDDDVILAAVWSLSQLGGEGVRPLLEKLYDEAEDDETADILENALENLSFTEDMSNFELFELDLDDEGHVIDPEDDDVRRLDEGDDGGG